MYQHAVSKRLAALVARCCDGARALRMHTICSPDRARQAATLLPALAGLSQLTRVAMWVPEDNLSQLPMQHLPAQLQQLELIDIVQCATADLPWLALDHITGLTRLSMQDACVDGGVLPRGVRSLAVASVSSVAPLQRLEQLTALRFRRYNSVTSSAGQLRQLSMLSRLEQLSMSTLGAYQADLSDALATLAVLPLTELSVHKDDMPPACLAHLGACTRLTALVLTSFYLFDDDGAKQLAAAVARLTALEQVLFRSDFVPPAGAAGWWAPVCMALAQLPRLTFCHLKLPRLGAAAAHLAAATQLTELDVLAAGCGFDNGCLATICTGLTGLQRLDVSTNRLLTDGCLACIAAMPRLMIVHLRETGVTDDGVQQLCAARPLLQVRAAFMAGVRRTTPCRV